MTPVVNQYDQASPCGCYPYHPQHCPCAARHAERPCMKSACVEARRHRRYRQEEDDDEEEEQEALREEEYQPPKLKQADRRPDRDSAGFNGMLEVTQVQENEEMQGRAELRVHVAQCMKVRSAGVCVT